MEFNGRLGTRMPTNSLGKCKVDRGHYGPMRDHHLCFFFNVGMYSCVCKVKAPMGVKISFVGI